MATKTGGGLLGRADSTLVQGAYRAEMANVGRDMSGVYRLEAQNISNLQTAIEDIFYATNKSNNELYNDIKEKSSLILADIESGTFSDDTSIDLYTNAINDLREQAKSIPRGKKGEAQRAKIRAQLAKMKVDSANGEGVITEIATLINNDQISKDAITENDLKLFNDILNQKAKREIINGELVYSTVDKDNNIIKINHNELNKRFIKKDYSVENAALKLSSGYTKIGRSGVAFDFDEAVNAYEKIMTTREGFLHLINKPFGTMKISFAQALQGKDAGLVTEMISALNNIGGVDIDNDGTPDQITKDNYKKLADVLINPDAANLSIAKRAAAAFYADRDGRAQHKKGKNLYDARQREQEESQTPKTNKYGGFAYASDTGGDPTAGVDAFTNISYSDKVARRKSLLNLETVPGAHYSYKYDKNNEGGWAAYDGTEFVRNMSGAEVARIEGLMSAGDNSFSDFNVSNVERNKKNKDLQPKKPGQIGLGSINIEGNTTKDQVKRVANNLEKVFGENFKNDFSISVISKTKIGGGGMFGKSSTTSITPNKIRIKSKDGRFDKTYDIGPNATQETVDQINMDFADYITIDSSYEDQ
jgi:hypothetical protein